MSERTRVYLSGPISGIPDARERFAEAADLFDPATYEVVNPFDLTPSEHPGQPCPPGYDPGENDLGHTSSACFMRSDIAALLTCDQILMLGGWRESRGARVERDVAEACGIEAIGYTRADLIAYLTAAGWRHEGTGFTGEFWVLGDREGVGVVRNLDSTSHCWLDTLERVAGRSGMSLAEVERQILLTRGVWR